MIAYYHYRYLLYFLSFELKDKRCNTGKKYIISINCKTGQPKAGHPVHLNTSLDMNEMNALLNIVSGFNLKKKWIEKWWWWMIHDYAIFISELLSFFYFVISLLVLNWAECKIKLLLFKKNNLILKSTQVFFRPASFLVCWNW